MTLEEIIVDLANKGVWYPDLCKWLEASVTQEPYKQFSRHWGVNPPPKIEKPCHVLEWCPYGRLVGAFPPGESEISCEVFGHDCPAFRCAELVME